MKLKSMKLLTLSLLLTALIKRTSFLVAVIVLGSVAVRPAFAVTAAVPTVGLAVTSVGVGALGVLGGGWKTRLLGYAVGIIDPDPATFYEGKIVITYPEDLLAVTGIGWFGNFAEDPSLPVPSVVSTPFFEFDPATTPYNFLQQPNPILGVSTSATGGIVTVEFDASPNGVTVNSNAHFNLLSIMFQNISGQELQWEQADPSEPANFFSNPAQQILTCRPDPSYPVPVTCGVDAEPYRYQVSAVPEPETLWLLATGFVGLLVITTGGRASKGAAVELNS